MSFRDFPQSGQPIRSLSAGVAQSVERVALMTSVNCNLKVVGSSPTFGYSYTVHPAGMRHSRRPFFFVFASRF
ncbi:unnamed protein product [Zymoseptoria tritici ST99CH_3D1]|nr:unnamed protein product [Zymoseptoria tritici ST99CH_3D1]